MDRTPRTRLARDYPCILEWAKCEAVPENHPIPIYVPTIDLSDRENIKLCQEQYQARCIDPNGSNSPLLQLPTVTINGSKFDIRTLTEDQLDFVESRRGNNDEPHRGNANQENREYPFFQELARTEQVPTNAPIPLYVPSIDMSDSTHFRLCQQHFRKRCIDLNASADYDALLQLPTVTVAGKKYDVRTMTAEQIDLVQNSNQSEEAFLRAGTSGRMHEELTMQEVMQILRP